MSSVFRSRETMTPQSLAQQNPGIEALRAAFLQAMSQRAPLAFGAAPAAATGSPGGLQPQIQQMIQKLQMLSSMNFTGRPPTQVAGQLAAGIPGYIPGGDRQRIVNGRLMNDPRMRLRQLGQPPMQTTPRLP
jgi:hypothetical protein